MDAAAVVFARKGYGGAGTKEIAELARTSETVIYRHFASKADLFSAAVLAPFIDFIAEYKAFFTRCFEEEKWDDHLLMEQCVATLYDHLHEHRNAVIALVAAGGDPAAEGPSREAARHLNELFDSFRELSLQRWEQGGGFEASRLHIWNRLIVGMIVSVTALEPWFVPDGWNRPTRNELVDAMTELLLHGYLGSNPEASSTSAPKTKSPKGRSSRTKDSRRANAGNDQ